MAQLSKNLYQACEPVSFLIRRGLLLAAGSTKSFTSVNFSCVVHSSGPRRRLERGQVRFRRVLGVLSTGYLQKTHQRSFVGSFSGHEVRRRAPPRAAARRPDPSSK